MRPSQIEARAGNHGVFTVTEKAWSCFKNGELLALAETEFDVFLTVDQNLSFQQDLKRFN
jgi:hypothetical protein